LYVAYQWFILQKIIIIIICKGNKRLNFCN